MLPSEANGSNDKIASFYAILIFDEKSEFHQQVSSCLTDEIGSEMDWSGRTFSFFLMPSFPPLVHVLSRHSAVILFPAHPTLDLR